jgi:SAM-dependent methyltransferase
LQEENRRKDVKISRLSLFFLRDKIYFCSFFKMLSFLFGGDPHVAARASVDFESKIYGAISLSGGTRARRTLSRRYYSEITAGESNPLLEQWEKAVRENMPGWSGEENCRKHSISPTYDNQAVFGLQALTRVFAARDKLVHSHAWGIPNAAAIQAILKYGGSILEIGAGTGYWAALLQKEGADVTAVDIRGRNDGFHPIVRFSGREYLLENAEKAKDSTLLVVWPHQEVLDSVLEVYMGDTVALVGEDFGQVGCTGRITGNDWTKVEEVFIPVWPTIHDTLQIFKRAGGRRGQ